MRLRETSITLTALILTMPDWFDQFFSLHRETMSLCVPQIVLGEVHTSSKGQKSIPISYASNQGDRVFIFPGKQDVPFSPAAYQQPDANRLNLCFGPPTEDFRATIAAIDEQIKAQLTERLKEIFDDGVTELTYHSPIKQTRNGLDNIRTKINVDALRIWNGRKQLAPPPEDWGNVSVSPRIWVKQVYIMNKEAGLILECPDVCIEPKQISCPF